MLQDFQTEIKLFFIVLVVAVIIAVGAIFLLKAAQMPVPIPQVTRETTQPAPSPQPTINNEQSAIETSNWQTHRNAVFGFELKYPKKLRLSGPDERPVLIDESGKQFISISFRDRRGALEVSFCAEYLHDTRCEVLETANTQFTIDWVKPATATTNTSRALFALYDVTPSTKNLFKQILSTVRFVYQEPKAESIILMVPVIEYEVPGNKLTEPIVVSYAEEEVEVGEEFIIDDAHFGFTYEGAGDLKFKLVNVGFDKITVDIIAEQWPVDREFHPKDPPERVAVSTDTCVTPFQLVLDVFYQYCFELQEEGDELKVKYQITRKSTLPQP